MQCCYGQIGYGYARFRGMRIWINTRFGHRAVLHGIGANVQAAWNMDIQYHCSHRGYRALEERNPGIEWCCMDEEQRWMGKGLVPVSCYGCGAAMHKSHMWTWSIQHGNQIRITSAWITKQRHMDTSHVRVHGLWSATWNADMDMELASQISKHLHVRRRVVFILPSYKETFHATDITDGRRNSLIHKTPSTKKGTCCT